MTKVLNPNPKTLDGAVTALDEYLNPDEKQVIKENPSRCHHGTGAYLRNYWGLWHHSDLAKWFRDNYQIVHADDMSGIILCKYSAVLNNKPFSVLWEVLHYHEHWKKLGVFKKMIQEFDSKVTNKVNLTADTAGDKIQDMPKEQVDTEVDKPLTQVIYIEENTRQKAMDDARTWDRGYESVEKAREFGADWAKYLFKCTITVELVGPMKE
jgi:hypothetical protein